MMKSRFVAALSIAIAIVGSGLTGCFSLDRIWKDKGEVQLTRAAPPPAPGPRVIIFALDGACHDQLLEAVRSGKAPNIAGLLGKEKGNEIFEHAYSAPNAINVLPSSTIADWSAMFTGAPPAWNGVPGDEWFVRETGRFYAPVPISVADTSDMEKTITGGLVGKAIETPTLFELVGLRSNVSLLSVHRGATFYTTVEPTSFTDLVGHLIKGKLAGESADQSLSGALDLDSVQKAIDAINEHGIPNLQVIYFPGVDIFTHATKDPLNSQVGYLEAITDKGVGEVLDVYRKKAVLDETYVLFVADHGHTPTMNDDHHALGGIGDDTPFGLVEKTGFRVRKPILGDADKDYQAVLAYQGFMAYIYLADRTTCPKDDDHCNWSKPPRFNEDVMPVVRAFDKANRTGDPIARLKGTIDLIFAREPVPPGQNAKPFEIFDGTKLVPIRDYLQAHPRPDLVDLSERMKWLGAGPYGNRAGDILLLSRASMQLPIQDRYYFAGESHYSWHGSPNMHDSNIPLILAQKDDSGERLRDIVRSIAGDSPTELDVTPLVRALFGRIYPQKQVSASASP
jgi:hypothetical protein